MRPGSFPAAARTFARRRSARLPGWGKAYPNPSERALRATTPGGEPLFARRKIIPPPTPLVPTVADTAAGDIAVGETSQAKPAVPDPSVKVKPAVPEISVVPRPAAPI